MSLVADELPEGWCVATIDQLCDLNPKHDSSLKANLPVSFVPMAAVSEVDGRITTPEVRPLGEVKKGFTHFADGDVVLAKITPCMENGKAASVRGMVNGLACGTTEFFVFRSRGAIDQDYLFKFIRQESFRRAARATMQSGVGQARVPKEFVLETEIPLAPLPEQRRIVAKIEALQARSRKSREALEAIPPLLEQFRQSVLAAAFRGDLTADWREQHPDVEPASVLLERIRAERRRKWEQAELAKFKAKGKVPQDDSWKAGYVEPEPVDDSDLPELPEGWGWVTATEVVDDEADIRYGIVQPGPPLKHGVPYVRGVDIQDGRILVDQLWNTSDEIARQYRNSGLRTGDVLLGIIRHLKVAIVPKELDGGNMARTTARFRPSELVSSEYLAGFLESPLCQNWLKGNYRGGTSMPKVNIADVIRLPIPIAPISEQSVICDRIRKAKKQYVNVRGLVTTALNECNLFDQSILAKAFRGELVPQDLNDEPASVLLERIQADRADDTNCKPSRGRRKQETTTADTPISQKRR